MAEQRAARLTRPMAGDIRWWRDAMQDALNEIGVKIGDDFEIVPASGRKQAKLSAPDQAAPGGARSSDPATSQAGAADVAPRSGTHRAEAIWAVHRSPRGLVAKEVEAETHITGIWKRCSELERDGYFRTDGERLCQETGSMQRIYVLDQAGRDWIAGQREPSLGF